MSDLLVKLYDLPPLEPALSAIQKKGFQLRRPIAPERAAVLRWVEQQFNERWASEIAIAFSRPEVRCFIALNDEGEIVGFAGFDATFRGFFGPTGVDPSFRGKGIGTALLLRALHAMWENGHAYGIIGASSMDSYYIKAVRATPIPDSDPGPYRDMLH